MLLFLCIGWFQGSLDSLWKLKGIPTSIRQMELQKPSVKLWLVESWLLKFTVSGACFRCCFYLSHTPSRYFLFLILYFASHLSQSFLLCFRSLPSSHRVYFASLNFITLTQRGRLGNMGCLFLATLMSWSVCSPWVKFVRWFLVACYRLSVNTQRVCYLQFPFSIFFALESRVLQHPTWAGRWSLVRAWQALLLFPDLANSHISPRQGSS